MRVLMLLPLLLLTGCLEWFGAYTCDSYCTGISDKVETCAADQGVSWQDLTGGDKNEVLDNCQDEIDARNLSDIQCQAETAGINNADCATIVETAQGYL